MIRQFTARLHRQKASASSLYRREEDAIALALAPHGPTFGRSFTPVRTA